MSETGTGEDGTAKNLAGNPAEEAKQCAVDAAAKPSAESTITNETGGTGTAGSSPKSGRSSSGGTGRSTSASRGGSHSPREQHSERSDGSPTRDGASGKAESIKSKVSETEATAKESASKHRDESTESLTRRRSPEKAQEARKEDLGSSERRREKRSSQERDDERERENSQEGGRGREKRRHASDAADRRAQKDDDEKREKRREKRRRDKREKSSSKERSRHHRHGKSTRQELESDNERQRKRRRSRDGDDRRKRKSSTSPRRREIDRDRRGGSREADNREETRTRASENRRTEDTESAPTRKEPMDILKTRTGGAYIPPAKLKMLQEQIADKNSEQYQRINWERLKKKIHGQVNKANTSNLVNCVRDLLQENIIRGKGLLARSIIQAQSFSPTFSNVYAALVAIINSKFPHIGELILRRLIVQFKRSFRRNDKTTTVTVSKFIAHLINQQVAHEILALELMILLLENPTDDSVEVTVAFLKECGAKLTELSPKGINSIFDRLRMILSEGELDKRTQYMIEVIFHIRKDKFQAYPSVTEELDLIDEEDQITHTITLEDAVDPENELNVFKLDPEFEKNEAMYDEIRREIIGEPGESSDEEDEEGGESGEEGTEADGGDEQKQGESKMTIIDNTEQNLVAFRRLVYLIIQSSLEYQEAAHKLLKLDLKTGQDVELCHMIVDCCAQQRTYENFFGLLAERFCRLRKEFQETFERIARDTYNTIHRFEITKLRNMARLVAHLLSSDAISWDVLDEIALNEEDTTSAGRIYIKIIFQELAEFMSVDKLMERIRDPTMQSALDKIFPRDNPNNTRFAINFFTSIGLGSLTIDLRRHLLQSRKKKTKSGDAAEDGDAEEEEDSSSSSSSSSSDSDSDSDSDSSSSSDSSGDSDSDSDSGSSSSSSSSSGESSPEPKKKAKRIKDGKKKRKKTGAAVKTEEPDEHSKEKENRLPHMTRTIKEEPLSPAERSGKERETRVREGDNGSRGEADSHRTRKHDDREEQRAQKVKRHHGSDEARMREREKSGRKEREGPEKDSGIRRDDRRGSPARERSGSREKPEKYRDDRRKQADEERKEREKLRDDREREENTGKRSEKESRVREKKREEDNEKTRQADRKKARDVDDDGERRRRGTRDDENLRSAGKESTGSGKERRRDRRASPERGRRARSGSISPDRARDHKKSRRD